MIGLFETSIKGGHVNKGLTFKKLDEGSWGKNLGHLQWEQQLRRDDRASEEKKMRTK